MLTFMNETTSFFHSYELVLYSWDVVQDKRDELVFFWTYF